MCATEAGLFSILIFRLITFNTAALREMPSGERKAVFGNLSAWEEYIEAVKTRLPGHDEDFYCNTFALGHNKVKERTLANARSIWEASQSSKWTEFCQDLPLSFRDCFKKIGDLHPQGGSKIPGLGILTQYLVCTDLVYSGAVAMPSAEEIGQRIYQLGKGGLRGLQFLGYCDKSPSEEGATAAFVQFVRDIEEALSVEEKTEMGWDVLVAEHCLCKISRLKHHLKM